MVQIKTVPISRVVDFIKQYQHLLTVILLFGGDRLLCCDEAVIAEEDGRVISLATIAPKGEAGEGPTIVGLFTLKAYRRQGIARRVLQQAILRCAERQLVPVRISLLSSKSLLLVNTLGPEYKDLLEIDVQAAILDMIDDSEE
jgi:GNAT superfamily N-acetyltransferase